MTEKPFISIAKHGKYAPAVTEVANMLSTLYFKKINFEISESDQRQIRKYEEILRELDSNWLHDFQAWVKYANKYGGEL